MCQSCLLAEITLCTFNQRLIHRPLFVFSLKHDPTSSPGQFSSIKRVQPCSEATDGQRQTRPNSGSPSQLLWHVRHAGVPCHSPLLHCNKGWADSPPEGRAQVARRDVRRDGAPVSRPRVRPQTSFQSSPLLLLLKLSVHLILLQFHLSPHKPSNQHPLCSLQTVTHTFLFAFPSLTSPSIFHLQTSHSHTCYPPPLGPSPPPQPPSPSTPSVAFQGCAFHALVAGQARGDFPRWGLKVGQELVVWSDVSAGIGICVS